MKKRNTSVTRQRQAQTDWQGPLKQHLNTVWRGLVIHSKVSFAKSATQLSVTGQCWSVPNACCLHMDEFFDLNLLQYLTEQCCLPAINKYEQEGQERQRATNAQGGREGSLALDWRSPQKHQKRQRQVQRRIWRQTPKNTKTRSEFQRPCPTHHEATENWFQHESLSWW